MKLPKRRIQTFQNVIFSWWKENKRDLPWRRTNDPYKIFVSEVMLQQTQVLRVIPKYAEFIKASPTVEALAHKTPAQVLKLWKGMGYNRRALYLHKAAKAIVEAHRGKFPKNLKELVKLPGVGNYTARAVLVFAYGQDVAMVDTNIRKIITHFFFHGKPQKEHIIEEVADQLLPKEKSWEWHQALMDYGALELVKLERPERSRRTIVPFKDSNRFYRGRIVDRLREGDISESQLCSEFQKQYKKPLSFIKNIIKGLIRDGLVGKKKGNVLSLPVL